MNNGNYGWGYNASQPVQQNTYNQPVQTNQNSMFTTARFVHGPNDIRPQDIPMDRTPAFFPQIDGSCIYVKFWDSACNLQTMRFVPENTNQNIQPVDPMEEILRRLTNLETQMGNYNKPSDAGSYYSKEESK